MVCSGITIVGIFKGKVDPSGVCCLIVMANSVLCLQCGKWIHGRCAGVKMMTSILKKNFACRKCERNIKEAVEQDENM